MNHQQVDVLLIAGFGALLGVALVLAIVREARSRERSAVWRLVCLVAAAGVAAWSLRHGTGLLGAAAWSGLGGVAMWLGLAGSQAQNDRFARNLLGRSTRPRERPKDFPSS